MMAPRGPGLLLAVILTAIVCILVITPASATTPPFVGTEVLPSAPLGSLVEATDPGAMDMMAIDMDPSGNAAASLGPRDFCARMNENDMLDGDEDDVDQLTIDVTTGPVGIPPSNPMVAFGFALHYPARLFEVVDEDNHFLLVTGDNDMLWAITDHVPSGDGEFLDSAIDFGNSVMESGPGVLSRLKLRSTAGAGPGIYLLALTGSADGFVGLPQHIDSENEVHYPTTKAANIALNSQCPDGEPVPPGPSNDDFSNARDITVPGFGDQRGWLDGTLAATVEPGEPLPCGAIASTVWYRFGLPHDGLVEMSTFNSDYRTVLTVYRGESLDNLDMVACGSGEQILELFVDGGVFYYLQVASATNAGGNLQLGIFEMHPGDVDCDYQVDAVDALHVLEEVAELSPWIGCLHLGDVDCDSVLTSRDALMILRRVAGAAKRLEPCRPEATGATLLNRTLELGGR